MFADSPTKKCRVEFKQGDDLHKRSVTPLIKLMLILHGSIGAIGGKAVHKNILRGTVMTWDSTPEADEATTAKMDGLQGKSNWMICGYLQLRISCLH